MSKVHYVDGHGDVFTVPAAPQNAVTLEHRFERLLASAGWQVQHNLTNSEHYEAIRDVLRSLDKPK